MLIVVSNREAWKTNEPWTQTYLYSNADMICSLHCIHIFQLRKWHNFEKKYVQFKIKFTSNQHTYKCQFEWVQAICHWLVLTFQSRTLPRNSPHIMSQNHKKTMQYEQRCAICNMQYMHRFMHSCESQEKVSNVSWESWIWDWSPFLFWKKWIMVNKYK